MTKVRCIHSMCKYWDDNDCTADTVVLDCSTDERLQHIICRTMEVKGNFGDLIKQWVAAMEIARLLEGENDG